MFVSHKDALSGFLYLATTAAIVVFPVLVAAGWALRDDPLLFAAAETGLAVTQNPTRLQLVISFALGLLPGAVIVWVLVLMRRLFAAFARGDAMSVRAASLIRQTGRWFVILAAVQFALVPLQSVILSWGGPVGTRALLVAISSGMAGALLAAGLLIVIGRTLLQASEIAAENREFV